MVNDTEGSRVYDSESENTEIEAPAKARAQRATTEPPILELPGAQLGKHAGTVVGTRAVGQAKDAARVIEAIERTHTNQVGRAASKPSAIKHVASKVMAAADDAAGTGRRAGGMEQLKGHFVEILDVEAYNAKNRLTGKRLIPRPKGTAEAYDATRIVNKRFAGGVQQKSSASHVEKTIKAMERKKPGSARKGVLRVPRDQVDAARRRAGGRVKEVKGMEFTRHEATSRVEKGVGDVASRGTKAASQARALGKAGVPAPQSARSLAVSSTFPRCGAATSAAATMPRTAYWTPPRVGLALWSAPSPAA
jgi:hypothetical protein